MGNDSTTTVGLEQEKSCFRNDSLKRIAIICVLLAIFIDKKKVNKNEEGCKGIYEKKDWFCLKISKKSM